MGDALLLWRIVGMRVVERRCCCRGGGGRGLLVQEGPADGVGCPFDVYYLDVCDVR